MIIGYRHRGLERYATQGDRSKLQQTHIAKIRLVLTRLEAATAPEQLNQPGYNFHPLKGNLEGHYSVKISGNWRITFRFEGEDATDVDYLDYH